MRDLEQNELINVSGGCCSPCPPSEPTAPSKMKKGNNGFGNGADDNLAAPGGSAKTGGGKDMSVGDDRGAR